MSAPIKVDHPLVMEDGLVFGLEDEFYHGALAMSSSGVRNMRMSRMDFWARSPLNPDPEEKDTDALRTGRLYDRRIVEGKKAFYDLYAPDVDPKLFPNALRTNDELKEAIKLAGGPEKGVSGLRKAELAAKLLEYDPDAQIWESIVELHRSRYPNRDFVAPKLVRQMELAAASIEMNPELRVALSGGMPQVSVFWTDPNTGVPCKARFDYLKPHAITDFKTFSNIHHLPIEDACAKSVESHGYDVQATFYLRAMRHVRQFAADGRVTVEGGRAHPGLVGALAAAIDQPVRFYWIFQQKGIAPVALGYWFDEGPAMDESRKDIDLALAEFAECWTKHGTEQWVVKAPMSALDHYKLWSRLKAA